jgi:hypothetical protein
VFRKITKNTDRSRDVTRKAEEEEEEETEGSL